MTAPSSEASSAPIGGSQATRARAAKLFERDSYAPLQEFLTDPLLDISYRYARLQAVVRKGVRDEHLPDTPSFYGDLLMDTLLERATPAIEAISGLELYPTYSYYRVYQQGDVLLKHKDRPSCEVSVTLCLGGGGDGDHWPMFVRRDDQDQGVPLACQPGDGIVYRGCEVEHWRDAFEGEHQVQVFFHYVDRSGPHAGHKWDRRPRLGTPRRPSLKALRASK